MEAEVRLPVHEGVQLTAPEYRNHLYQVLGPVPSGLAPTPVTDPPMPFTPTLLVCVLLPSRR